MVKKLLLRGSKGSITVEVLFDSGAFFSFIKKAIAEKIGELQKLPEPEVFSTAKEGEEVIATHTIDIKFYINKDGFPEIFYVIDNLSEDAIIGVGTMQKFRFKLDFERDEITYPPQTHHFKII